MKNSKHSTLLARNLAFLMKRAGLNPTSLANAMAQRHSTNQSVGVVPQATIFRILAGESQDPKTSTLTALADFFGSNVNTLRGLDLEAQRSNEHFENIFDPEHPLNNISLTGIPYFHAPECCGGGKLLPSDLHDVSIAKEPSFFLDFNVRPQDLFAIRIDGDSMADFLVDGDVAIFSTKMKTPQSGHIFAIRHPDGVRIKQLRRDIDSSWILESKNLDKRRFPDERVALDNLGLLSILGQLIYRQSGAPNPRSTADAVAVKA